MSISNEAIYEACARAAHEANRAYCIALGDMSQVPWHEAPDWQRKSCLVGVQGVLEKGNGPRESHESWLKEKEATGWKYGPVKDPEKKEHPCFVPYDELPAEQQVKDSIFTNTVRLLASALGYHGVTSPVTFETRLKRLELNMDLLWTSFRQARREKTSSDATPPTEAPEEEEDNPEITMDLLLLVTEADFPLAHITAWTPAQRKEAEAWAAQQHLLAADHEFDEILPKPVHVRELEETYPKRT